MPVPVIETAGPARLVRVGGQAVDVRELDRFVRTSAAGGVALFLGTTRADRLVEGVVEALDYEAAQPLAERELARIAEDAAARFELAAVAIHHALGRIPVGEASLGVAVAAPHRAAAFAAAEWTVTAIKTRAPIWKRAVLEGGWLGPWAEGTPVRLT